MNSATTNRGFVFKEKGKMPGRTFPGGLSLRALHSGTFTPTALAVWHLLRRISSIYILILLLELLGNQCFWLGAAESMHKLANLLHYLCLFSDIF